MKFYVAIVLIATKVRRAAISTGETYAIREHT
jgi:hypothetical protein